MLSWRLWQSLRNPLVEHPAFDVVSTGPLFKWDWLKHIKINWLLQILFGLLAVYLVTRFPMLIFLVVLSPALLVLFIMAIPVSLPFLIVLYGSILATLISNRIRTEKRTYTYDLLCVSPNGSLGMTWLMSMWAVRQGQLLRWLHIGVRVVLFLAAVSIGIILLVMLVITLQYLSGNQIEYLPDAIRTIVEIVAIVTILYTGFFQTIVISALIGMLIPHINTYWYDVSPIVIGSYITIQLGSYFLIFWIVVALNSTLYARHDLVDILLPVLYCVVAFFLREGIIALLWRHLVYKLNATHEDIQLVQQFPV